MSDDAVHRLGECSIISLSVAALLCSLSFAEYKRVTDRDISGPFLVRCDRFFDFFLHSRPYAYDIILYSRSRILENKIGCNKKKIYNHCNEEDCV